MGTIITLTAYSTGDSDYEEAGEDIVGADNIDFTWEAMGSVKFKVQPNVSESGSALYTNIDNVRQPGTLLIYNGSPGRDFTIAAKFISRTVDEAAENLRYVRHLRSWRQPESEGESGANSAPPAPARLQLSGLGGWFNNIWVRMTSLSIETNDDVDYIKVGEVDVPIVWSVTTTLKETRSVNELMSFSIEAFRNGTLDHW